jgi:signal recognition particle receptor subunit beta
MPRIDRRSGDIVLRIVFDGSPEAGKTTTIDHLASLISLQRRSPVARPGTSERRTEFFDWVDFAGGYLDGRRVRCQLLSVPGQASLLHRRRYLLDTADVIVFVADATAPAAGVEGDYGSMCELAARSGTRVPLGVVLQVNKQDLAGAAPPRVLADALGVSPLVPVVGTSARSGVGIMQTLILAVRLATDRARALLLDELLPQAEHDEGPTELYHALLALEPRVEVAASAADDRGASLRPDAPDAHAARKRPNPAREQATGLPSATALSAGCSWPSVTGRAALAAANQGRASAPESLSGFAPDDAFEIETSNGWVFHSQPAWLFSSDGEARFLLLSLARKLTERPAELPEGRSLLVAPEGSSFRLWALTRRVPSLATELVLALEAKNVAELVTAWQALHDFSAARAAGPGPLGAVALEELALQRERIVVLSLPGATDRQPPADGLAELERLLSDVCARRPELRECLNSARVQLDGRFPLVGT